MSYSRILRQITFVLSLAVAAFVGSQAIAAPTISYPAFGNTTQTSNRVLPVTLIDAVGVATGGVAPRIYLRKNAGGYLSQACNLVSGTVNNGGWDCDVNYAFVGGVVLTDVISYFVIAQDTAASLASNPAGVVASNVNTVTTPPVPNSYTIVTVLPTTINVGPAETITSLTNVGGVFERINNGSLVANTVVNITGDLVGELGTVALNQLTEDGAGGYTLLIRPSGGPRTVTGSNTGGLVRLNGADRVTIDGSTSGATATGVGGNAALRELTIQNTNVSTNAVVIAVQSGTAGAQNNTLKNLNVLGQDPTTTIVGIALGGNTPGTAGADNDNNRIENCSVRRAVFGIYSAGQSAANPNTGTVITMNDLSSTTTDRLRRVGIFVVNENGIQITQNSIGGLDTNESTDGVGIGLGTQAIDTSLGTAGGVTNALVSRNRINGVNSQSTTGFSAVGIAVAGAAGGANVIVNNMISGITSPATSPDLVAGIFVAGVTGSSTRLLYNSVSMTGNRGAVASQMPSYAVAITGTDPTVELKNNAFSTTQTASGGGVNAKSYAIGMVSTTFTNLDANYNAYYSSGANAGFFRSGILGAGSGTDYATVAAWRVAIADDANSLQVDPLFVSTTDLHLQATSPLIAAATPVSGVTVDIDGQTRSATLPAIGADDILPTADLAITNTDGVSTVTAGGSTTYTITASNAGPANVTGANVSDTFPASLTCTWTCTGAGGGTCTAAGAGNINDTVNLPAGGSVTYTASCTISPSTVGSLVNIATVSSAVSDPTSRNNSATDTNTITALTYVVAGVASPLAGGGVTCTSPVNHGGTTTCAVTTNAGYTLISASSSTCTGSLAASTYTTGAVTSTCTVTAIYAAIVNATCGSANTVAVAVAPSANLCADASTPAVTTTSSQFTWTCSGANGGSNASCAAPRTYTVTPSVSGGNGTATGGGAVVSGSTGSVTITANAGFVIATPIGGTCGGTLAGNAYTTSAVSANCTVIASFVAVVNATCGSANTVAVAVAPSANLCADASTPAVTTTPSQFTWSCSGANGGSNASCAAPRTYTVTPSVSGGNGTAVGGGAVVSGSSGSVTITANAGFVIATPVGGTCGGTLAGNAYTTSAVTANCTVIASFLPIVNASCGSTNGVAVAAAPSTNLCADASTPAVTTTPSQFTWTCNGANTGSNASCAAPRTYTVTSSVSGGNGTAVGGGAVVSGSTGSVTITANAGFVIATPVGGTCGGTLAGNAYTTSAVSANCTVIASFVAVVNATCGSANTVAVAVAPSANLCADASTPAVTTTPSQFTWLCSGANGGNTASCAAPRTYTVTASVSGGNGTAVGGGAVVSGSTGSVTITPNAGFVIATPVGGTCGGTLAGNAYTTSAVSANCTVIASFVAVVNATCGSANTVAVAVAPSANLCADASTPAVTTTPSQFTWSCSGANGGTNSSCAAPRTYTVTPSVVGGNGTAVGGGAVVSGSSGSVTITANAGFFTLTPVGGTCGGSLSGTAFATSPIAADCTVIASFTSAITPSVSVSTALGGSVSCTPQTAIGGRSTCTVALSAGYRLASISGCGGIASTALTYVTGAINAPCLVTAEFIQDIPTVVPVSGGLWLWLLAALMAIASGVVLTRSGRA